VDYYASLGVARSSEDVVIRAAYLALMRRYHPDTNSSPEAADRAREITKAFAVLGDKEKRREYDRQWDPEEPQLLQGGRGKPLPVGPTGFAITMLCVSVLVGVIWTAQPAAVLPPQATAQADSRGNSSPDDSRSLDCMSPVVTKLVRGELMRQAMLVRGEGRSEFADLASRLAVRTTSGPALTGPAAGAISCSAAVTVDLPNGVRQHDGSTSLYGNIDYSVRSGPSEGPQIELTPDAGFLVDLASLRTSAEPRPDRAAREETTSEPLGTADVPKTLARMAPPPRMPRSATVQPELKPRLTNPQTRNAEPPVCAGDRWTTLICRDQNLAALNKQLTDFERQSLSHANAQKRERLERTRTQFEVRRTECRSETCIRGALVSRTTEVADIMRAAPVKP
jgi:hypothetical protein